MDKANLSIAITGMGSISPLGSNADEVWHSYQCKESLIKPVPFNGEKVPVARLSGESEKLLEAIRLEKDDYLYLDRTVIMALHCAREAIRQAGWRRGERVTGRKGDPVTGVNIGSSRGATELIEKYHGAYLENPSRRIFPLTSPTTTLGNISSTVAHDVETAGPAISHSVTCSTALHAVFNGIAWLRAGMADRFIVGGVEAPLTGFTIAQMKALRVYTRNENIQYPCRPCSSEIPLRNTFALGEGAALFALELVSLEELIERKKKVLGVIESLGYSQENSDTLTGITKGGIALQKAMTMALENMPNENRVDLIILHAPGTIKGDASELNAVRSVFGNDLPLLASNKWLTGHTFGASGALSLEYALYILEHDTFINFPYPVVEPCESSRTSQGSKRRPIRKIMINAAGFGGNAASLIVSKI